jgi:hypothetical protein
MADETPAPRAWMPRWTLKTLALALGLGLFLVGLVWLGKWALAQIRGQDRYIVAFKDIDCLPPPGLERAAFLDEVRYVSEIPDRLHLLDDDLAKRLSDAFVQHPWVEKVEQVIIEPPRQVQVRLRYRTPVLAVMGQARDGAVAIVVRSSWMSMKNRTAFARAVDRNGILLPLSAELEGLPTLHTPVKTAAGPSGTAWGDARVAAAARTADFLRPYQKHLRLEDMEVNEDGLVLSTPPAVRVLWGQAPGAEPPGEANALQKVDRLLAYCKMHGDLGSPPDWQRIRGYEHDVRLRGKAIHRLLPLPKER